MLDGVAVLLEKIQTPPVIQHGFRQLYIFPRRITHATAITGATLQDGITFTTSLGRAIVPNLSLDNTVIARVVAKDLQVDDFLLCNRWSLVLVSAIPRRPESFSSQHYV